MYYFKTVARILNDGKLWGFEFLEVKSNNIIILDKYNILRWNINNDVLFDIYLC